MTVVVLQGLPHILNADVAVAVGEVLTDATVAEQGVRVALGAVVMKRRAGVWMLEMVGVHEHVGLGLYRESLTGHYLKVDGGARSISE